MKTLTGNTREQLPSKGLNMCAREWCELVDLQKIKHTLSVEVGDNADMLSKVKALPQVDALVAVVLVVLRKCGEHPQLNPRRVTVFLNRPDDFDGAASMLLPVIRFYNLAKSTLSEESHDLI